ncbi:lysophospholipid acyltransferase 6 [Tribolium castaneum]|uniref:lysophospholipid acyltransferase 6 n=1 Tax=Tribolium castaneum TaxID=7070 RepID=UPI00046BEF9E|nr:PREDICTED: lysophospholipid acyltransferase 1 [Tribolium castaneum]|eukprot:XP_008201126.1 PREDICTED: lysophospholipid acyltransferase 1 [Tribolium castaneum]
MAQTVSDYYDGSRLFSGLSEYLGISVDKVNFVISQVGALFLASLFRNVLHPSKANAATRHAFGLVFALIIGYFCFGTQAIHLAALPAACYIVIRTQSPEVMQRMVLAVALVYLSVIHLHRQIYDYGSYNLDITGPLMVITQKVTSLAFNIHDGLTKHQEKLSKSQKSYAVTKIPNPLEYFSFVLHFPSLMAGPAMLYKEYMDFIDGSNLKSPVLADTPTRNAPIVVEPSPTWAVCKKVAIAAGCAAIFVKFLPMFPISRVKENDFVENTSITQKIVYLYICTTLVRFKYYFAWTLADAVCNNAGIGYNGVDASGAHRWDKFSNVDIFQFEFATNLRESIAAWNLGTNRWLRMIVYERVSKYSMVLTYSLSALWHGFYPGYYLTFANGALFTYASRVLRKRVRNYFLANAETKFFYDGVTFVTTRILMAYMVFTFVLLEFWPCIRLYMHMYWCLHLGALLAIFLVPNVIPKTEAGQAVKGSIAQAFVQARPITNGVSRHHD